MSSSFKKTAEPQSHLREFNVGDPDEPSANPMYRAAQQAPGYELSAGEREELQQYRRNISKEDKVGDYAKKRIEILADIGRLTKTIEIDGVTFTLRTLKSKEARTVTMSIFGCLNDVDASFEIRRQTLARAIYEIDGQPTANALGGDDFALRLALIDDMEDATIIKLYNEFNELRNEVQTKYRLNTEQEVKEVLEDIKKS
jgi:cell fate (sporulation/competence/biofilm development) regulator YlbF (YheA/YmcA/DUF963 family)